MQSCSHCDGVNPADAPYCVTCGQPRMIESLLTARPRPEWQTRLWNGVAIVGVAIFLVTSSVAFLREAKAVRVARQALDMTDPQLDRMAWLILEPFLQADPDHEEATFLAAIASGRVGEIKKSAEFRDRLTDLPPERQGNLDQEIERAIELAVIQPGCQVAPIFTYYDRAAVLGPDFHSHLVAQVQRAARRCQVSDRPTEAYLLLAGLVARGESESLIEQTYVEPLREAIAAARYDEAESLAQGARRFSPAMEQRMDQALQDVRDRVERSFQTVDAACRTIASAPEFQVGRFRCFPQIPPKALTEQRDGWNNRLHYTPLQLDPNLQCHQAFEIASYGADGSETIEATGNPDGDIRCRFERGRLVFLPTPEWFWRSHS